MTSAPRIGIVGAGRTRQGLGPFFAAAFEAAGARIAAVSGRDAASAARAAEALGASLGHPVAACGSAAELARAVDALVVAAPVDAHLAGLEAALAAGVPCLCEKPLVAPAQAARGLEVVAAFAARGLLLVENCQWPCVLDAAFALHPALRGARVGRLEMGLCPSGRGRAMVLDTLSHVLSVAQAVADLDPAATPRAVRQEDPAPDAERDTLRFELPCAGGGALAVTLRLERRERQPRPAWIALDGHRVDRRIGPGYAMSLVAPDGREQPLTDPLHALVYGFAAALTRPSPDDVRAHARTITTRLRCFAAIVADLDRRSR